MTALEAGSDIGASIRNPAHYCGVYGHKPTFNILRSRGVLWPGELAEDDLCVVLASDGLFGNVMTSEEVASRALEGFARHAHTGAPSTPCALAPA